MLTKNSPTPPEAGAQGTLTLERVNTAPEQTWNRLNTNDITLSVPVRSRKGSVYFALPRLFDRVECGMGERARDWAVSQAADARYVEVPARTVREEPVVVSINADAGEVTDTGVIVREGAEATIVVAVTGGADPAAAHATSGSLLRVFAEAKSHVSIIEIIGVGEAQQHLDNVGISADANAHVEVSQFALGGGTVALGLACDLAGAHARIDLSCRYHVNGAQVLDVNHVVRQRGRMTRAEISESGVLEDAAKKSLRTTIDLIHGAKGAKGNEADTVFVLGDDVVNKTVPVILCDEDDVLGNHGATIGSVSPEQLVYIQNRGLSLKEAERLFVRALFEDAIMNAPEPASHAAALAQAERVLGDEVAHDFDDARTTSEE